MCRHELKHNAEVTVHPLSDGPPPIDKTKAPDRFYAEVVITCAECGEPFHFIGPAVGLRLEGPSLSLDGTTLHIPIAPGRHVDLSKPIRFEMPTRARKV